MEDLASKLNTLCCIGCLSESSETYNYDIRNQPLKTIIQGDKLPLCHICKRMAHRAEDFIQNVQSNQILLANFHDIMDSTLQSVKEQAHPLIKLEFCELTLIQLSGDINEDIKEPFICLPATNNKVEIKLEIKEEYGELLEPIEVDLPNDNANDDAEDSQVKEEDFPLNEPMNVESEDDDISESLPKKNVKRRNIKKKSKKKLAIGERRTEREDKATIRHVYITREQCMEERARLAEDKKYLNSVYRCELCIKGFTFKDSYENHMEKHSKKMGEYECDICQQRMPSEERLQNHKRSHQVRYKCSECDFTRVSRLSLKDHFATAHCHGYYVYNCPHCPKVFRREVSMRKHVCYAHSNKDRVSCALCHKTYANKESLKAHIIAKHPNDEVSSELSRRYVCQECGMGFKAPSFLQKHSVKHSRTRDFYCVECDKSFKSDAVLQHHLKTALPHINYLELPLPCLHCDKRFAIKRDLERHTNRVHLNIRPYKCDKCEKAYVNGWSLKQHKMLIHEGYKRPLKYPCPMCDKVFDRNQILKGHIRAHTGERPYQCSKCPAKFGQASVLGTHMKLIHLKLTRDGRPKTVPMKQE